MTPRIAIVVAVARNGVIGADGDLAWRIPDDLKWFKSVTMGKPVIMGRKTFASIGKALPGRDNIVATRAPDFSAEGVFIVRSLEDGLTLGRAFAAARDVEEACVIGGADLYAQTIAAADRIYLSRVDAQVDGDACFPALDSADWSETRHSACEKNDRNQFACEFFILDRKARIPAKKR